MQQKSILLLTCPQHRIPLGEDKLLMELLTKRGWAVQYLPWQEVINPTQYSHALIRSTWDYHYQLPAFIQVLSEITNSGVRLLNPLRLIKWNAYKTYLRELELEGYPLPLTFWFDDLSEVNPDLLWPKTDLEAQWIIKPQVSAGATGTFHVQSSSGWKDISTLTQTNFGGPWIVQKFLPTVVSEGEISLMYFGEKFSHAVIKKPQEGDFRVQEDFGGNTQLYQAQIDEIELGGRILQSLPLPPLYARVDLARHPEKGHWLIMELELIEPSLFLMMAPEKADLLLDHLESLK